MTDELQEMPDAVDSRGNIFQKLGWLFFSPQKLFESIAQRPSWWEPFIWVSVCAVIGVRVFYPIQMALMRLNARGVPQEKLDQTIETMSKFYAAGYITAPIASIVQVLLVAFLGYLVLSVLSTQANFKKYFTLYFHSFIIVSLGSLLSLVLARQRGVDDIQSAADATVSFGLDFLVSPSHTYLNALASSINVFAVWSYIIMVMGLMSIFGLTRNKAITALIPLWLIFAVLSMVGAKFSNML